MKNILGFTHLLSISNQNSRNYFLPGHPCITLRTKLEIKEITQFQIFIFIYVLNTEYWSVIFLGLTKFIKKSQKVYLVIISFSNDQDRKRPRRNSSHVA